MQQLIEYGFHLAGEWRTPHCRVHRAWWLRHKPGVYAFVVGDRVCYVGKADRLHRRLRNYSNRCFGEPGAKKYRYCHHQIMAAIDGGQVVQVYALVPDDESVPLLQLEDRFIQEFLPPWNR